MLHQTLDQYDGGWCCRTSVEEALHIRSIGSTTPLNNGQPHLLPDVVHHIKWLRGGLSEIRLEQQINGPSMYLIKISTFGSNGVEVDVVHDVPGALKMCNLTNIPPA